MSSDLNELNANAEVGVDVSEYEKPSEFVPPIPRGTYTLIRDTEYELEWKPMGGKGKGNYYTMIRFLVQGGDFDGRSVFEMLSTMVSEFRKASSVQDYLAATGFDGEPENGSRFTLGEIQDAVEQTVTPFEAFTDVEAYCRECQKTFLKGTKKFPKDENGNPIYEVECPECGSKVMASTKIKRYVVE